MEYKDIDYTKYLSVDNGNGILLNKSDIETLERYGFNFKTYSNIKDLIIDLDNYCNECDDTDEIEEILNKLSEMYYYNYVNK